MHGKEKAPASTAGAENNAGIGLLSHTRICSIMGDEELDCRVRNGIGYTLFSMDTSKYVHGPQADNVFTWINLPQELSLGKHFLASRAD